MKKFMASAFIILIVPFLFPLFVHASDLDGLADALNEKFNAEYTITDQCLDILETIGSQYPNYYYYVNYLNTYPWQQYEFYCVESQFDDNGTAYSGTRYGFATNSKATGSVPSQSNFGIGTVNKTQMYYFGNYQDLLNFINPINFDNIYYSAQIPIPSIDVYMDSNNDDPTAGEAVWNATVELGDNSEYYIQWGIKISYPTYIDVGLASVNGNFTYNYYSYVSGTYSDIVTMESLTQAVAQGATSQYFQSGWEITYSVLKNNPPEFGSQINALNQNMLNNAAQYYVDYMLSQMPMYGNRLEVFARYFTIDSENNNRIVVGAWNHWNSKDGSRTKERPSNYIDNVALPGNIISNTDPDFQDGSDTYSSNGESTGTPATIINNNYAPNYPDYPTVATYNHDNILLNFMDTAKQLPSFFGEFTGFLTVAFGFIPSWIWTIIGMGFTFSIVIMIIKVL